MPEPAKPAAKRTKRAPKSSSKQRFERDGEDSTTEVVVDAAKLLDRLTEVTGEAERNRVGLESELAKRESLQAAWTKESALRDKAERGLNEAKTAVAALKAELETERAARKQAESDLARVDEKAALLEQQVNLTWNQLQVSEEEQQARRRWWRGDT